MKRHAIFAIAILFGLASLGALAGDGFGSSGTGETRGRMDWPTAYDASSQTANRIGSEDSYDLSSDIVTDVEGEGSNDRCEHGILPGEFLQFLGWNRQPMVGLPFDPIVCEDRPGVPYGTNED